MRNWLATALLFSCFFSVIFFATPSYFYSQEAKIRIVKEDAVLRLKPNNESIEIRKLPIGSEFLVEEPLGEWITIKLPPDKDGIIITGYVHNSYVEFSGTQSEASKEREKERDKIPQKIEMPEINIDDNYSLWKQKLDIAKSRKKAGDATSIIGLCVSSLGSLLYFTDLKETKDIDISYYTKTTTYENQNEYLLVSLGGLIISVIGYVTSEPAKDEIRALELEGAKKRYFLAGLAPIRGGLVFQLRWSIKD